MMPNRLLRVAAVESDSLGLQPIADRWKVVSHGTDDSPSRYIFQLKVAFVAGVIVGILFIGAMLWVLKRMHRFINPVGITEPEEEYEPTAPRIVHDEAMFEPVGDISRSLSSVYVAKSTLELIMASSKRGKDRRCHLSEDCHYYEGLHPTQRREIRVCLHCQKKKDE